MRKRGEKRTRTLAELENSEEGNFFILCEVVFGHSAIDTGFREVRSRWRGLR